MSKITTGILHDAEPLSVEQVKELEREVLENQKILVYLDTNKELCFSTPDASVDSIKCLAWNHAYELIEEDTRFVKNSYKKDGLYSFYLDKVLQKKNLEDAWEEEESSGGAVSLPTPNLDGAVTGSSSPIAYSWSELKALAQANLSADELRDTYGIEVGDYKEVDGVKYVLVDLDGNDYDGFVFMYNAGTRKLMNSTNAGGYYASAMKLYVDDGDDTNNVDLYDNLDADLKAVLKKVTITCNSGDLNKDGTDDNGMSVYTHDCHLFLASSKEVGFTISGYQYAAEGAKFDLFVDQTARANFATLANISSNWWLRSAESDGTNFFCTVTAKGQNNGYKASYPCVVVPAFVIG